MGRYHDMPDRFNLALQDRHWMWNNSQLINWKHDDQDKELFHPSSDSKFDTLSMQTYLIYHYSDVMIGTIASQITSLTILYLTVCSGADQRKHQNSSSRAFVRGVHRWPVKSPYKWPVMRKMFPFDDAIMKSRQCNDCVKMVTCHRFCKNIKSLKIK